MANGKDQVDQNALAAEWGLSLDGGRDANAAEGAVAGEGQEVAAQQWAASVDDAPTFNANQSSAERVLSQEEIDGLLGFSVADVSLNDNSGIRAIIDSAMVSYERLPMLEIVFDRLVRLMTTSLRNLPSDNLQVSLDRIT